MLNNIKKKVDKYFFDFFFITYCILVLLSFFYNFFEYDESWIFHIIINYKNDLTSTYSIPLAFGQSIYIELLSLFNLSDDPQNYFSNRVISLLAIFGNIFLIFKIITDDKKHNCNQILLICLFLYSFWFCFNEGGMSSRPDSLFSFLLFFLIYSFLQYKQKYYLFLISSTLNIFFIFYHPIGFYVLFINYCFLYCIISKKFFFLFNFIILFFLLILFTFTNIPQNFFESYNNFIIRFTGKEIIEIKDIFLILFNNISRDVLLKGRASHLLGYSVYSFIYFCILYSISIYAIYYFKNGNKNFKTFIFIFITLNIFYLILPNKWRHHLGVIVPVLIMIFYYMQTNHIKEGSFFKNNNNLRLINILLMIILLFRVDYYISNNFFLKNYLNKFFDTNKISYFKKLNLEQKKIDTLSYKLENLTFISDPVFKYVFNRSNYTNISSTYEIDFLIRTNKNNCMLYLKKKATEYEYFDNFVLYNKNYVICIKRDIFKTQ